MARRAHPRSRPLSLPLIPAFSFSGYILYGCSPKRVFPLLLLCKMDIHFVNPSDLQWETNTSKNNQWEKCARRAEGGKAFVPPPPCPGFLGRSGSRNVGCRPEEDGVETRADSGRSYDQQWPSYRLSHALKEAPCLRSDGMRKLSSQFVVIQKERRCPCQETINQSKTEWCLAVESSQDCAMSWLGFWDRSSLHQILGVKKCERISGGVWCKQRMLCTWKIQQWRTVFFPLEVCHFLPGLPSTCALLLFYLPPPNHISLSPFPGTDPRLV